MHLPINKIYSVDAFKGSRILQDKTIDSIVTSPPYWGLRDYGFDGQLGQEETPELFINNLINLFDILKQKLKDTGTLFVNLGDTYAGSGGGTTKNVDTSTYLPGSKQSYILPSGTAKSNQFRNSNLNKSLLMIPYRFAWKMVEHGWTLRNVINWRKPNQMPTSVKDRFTVDFEPIFFFSKLPKDYYFEQQLEPVKEDSIRRANYGWNGKTMANGKASAGYTQMDKMGERFCNPAGRNMRTTWDINTKGISDAHFAVYPTELCERMIEAGTPKKGLVLDPFMGSGTTALCAKKLKRNYIGFEANKDNLKISDKRLLLGK